MEYRGERDSADARAFPELGSVVAAPDDVAVVGMKDVGVVFEECWRDGDDGAVGCEADAVIVVVAVAAVAPLNTRHRG